MHFLKQHILLGCLLLLPSMAWGDREIKCPDKSFQVFSHAAQEQKYCTIMAYPGHSDKPVWMAPENYDCTKTHEILPKVKAAVRKGCSSLNVNPDSKYLVTCTYNLGDGTEFKIEGTRPGENSTCTPNPSTCSFTCTE